MLISADADSQVLHFLSYALIVPSMIIMVVMLIMNWMKNVKYFVTFEEIAKSELDLFFRRINKENSFKNKLEWRTAQLGHFWIELRIEAADRSAEENAFILADPKIRQRREELERQVSEENRLVDYENGKAN
jgi:membrane glycosyltransferase